MTNVERFTGGKGWMTGAALVGAVGLILTAVGAFLPDADGQTGPRFSVLAVRGPQTEGTRLEPATDSASLNPQDAAAFHTAGSPTHAQEALASYLIAFAYWLGIAVGALIWLAIFHAARARWMVILRRPLEIMSVAAPIFILLFLPIAIGARQIFMWTHDPASLGFAGEAVELLEHKRPYLNLPFFCIRACIYFFVWAGVGFLLHRWSTRQDEEGGVALTAKQRMLGAGALPFLGITITFAAFDWLMSLNPFWSSTIYGAYYFGGSFLAAMALLTLATTLAQRQNLWGTLVTQAHYHNLGKLLFAFTIFWAYLGFSQFLLIWIANLPEEGPWYILRMKGTWTGVSVLVAVGHFAVPFAFLLPRDVKLRPQLLAGISVWMLFMHYVDLYWMTMPTFYPGGFSLPWTAVTAFLGVGGLAIAFAIFRARGHFTVPVKDPYLSDSLRYVQP
nr:hypothetical protein Hi04_10k_c5202_00011 [uncultured bacterium]